MSSDRQTALAQLQQRLLNNNVAPQLAKQATQLVFGSGNRHAAIVFIGEAPGKKEDESGQPFMGAAGRVLDELLTEAGLQRDDVYITNIVKYRPPKNRDPTNEEKRAFWPYLLQELAIIQPRVIATLGRHSLSYIAPEAILAKAHGQTLPVSGELAAHTAESVVIPLYHPAAAIYNRALRTTLAQDMQALAQWKNLDEV